MKAASNRRQWLAPALGVIPALPSPALAQTSSATLESLLTAAPIAITLGALTFGLTATLLLIRARQTRRNIEDQASSRLGAMQAQVDTMHNVLTGLPEVTVVWGADNDSPRVFGPTASLIPEAGRADAILDFARWLSAEDAGRLKARIVAMRSSGQSFDLSPVARDGRTIRAVGRVAGGAAVLRLREAATQQLDARMPLATAEKPMGPPDFAAAKLVLGLLSEPAWIRNAQGVIVYVNSAYQELAHELGHAGDFVELLPEAVLSEQLGRLKESMTPVTAIGVLEEPGPFDAVLFRLTKGSAGFLRRRDQPRQQPEIPLDGNLEHIAAAIDTLTTPIAIFNADRNLVQYNRAYAELWALDPDWLATNPPETEILDRLRTQGLLPSEADYRAWRTRHLESYKLKSPREESWYLPDGRMVNVISAPASAEGGVIYVFEDRTEWLKLESENKALVEVQRETLNSLNEAVAVFGTNGRLTLYNQRLSALWKLPMGELESRPHIDQIAITCAKAMPEDGASIWRNLKEGIIDLNPTRTDTHGRLNRADGRLLDYAVVRLPDGQTLMTFTDVTEGVNYQRLLTERNEALIAADRLKDAFVQNVSYELRSPLTNIIGFADLLAAPETGPLNDRQREYTSFIRSSSATLGVLIDNILDLTTVDAGVAELHIEEQDIATLVAKAQAGLTATISPAEGDKPLNLVVDLEDDLPPLYADGTRIVQILYNLLSNAARFSEPGAEIKLSVRCQGDRIRFIIEDEGAGIPEDMRAALFRRFEGQAVEGRQRGAGLGLAIVQTFANLHGGTVSVASREPRGTIVTVNLPVHAENIAGAAE